MQHHAAASGMPALALSLTYSLSLVSVHPLRNTLVFISLKYPAFHTQIACCMSVCLSRRRQRQRQQLGSRFLFKVRSCPPATDRLIRLCLPHTRSLADQNLLLTYFLQSLSPSVQTPSSLPPRLPVVLIHAHTFTCVRLSHSVRVHCRRIRRRLRRRRYCVHRQPCQLHALLSACLFTSI